MIQINPNYECELRSKIREATTNSDRTEQDKKDELRKFEVKCVEVEKKLKTNTFQL